MTKNKIPSPVHFDVWQATDGSQHSTYDKALYRNRQIVIRDGLEQTFLGGPQPDSCDFVNGKLGYIQHDLASVEQLTRSLEAYEDPAFGKLAGRLLCIDQLGREWGQPAFTFQTFPDVNQTCLEDRRK